MAGLLADRFSDIWLAGEISGLRVYPSGHLYFSLKDEESQIDAVCFRSSAQRLRFEPQDGLEVLGHGRLDLYAPRGKYQVVLDQIEPRGTGALQQAFETLKKRLSSEGLFDARRKRPLPVLPRTVGIVTSPAGAALHDMLETLRLHRARVDVLVCPVQVQGEGAAGQIAAGVAILNEHGKSDVLIVGRGGGSIEDLWSFNEEVVARAIAASRIPVVSGVGHEVDFTIADFVADARAATPTAAAQLVARGWLELDQRLRTSADALVEAQEQVILDREQRLDASVKHRAFELVRTALNDAERVLETGLGAAERGLRAHLRHATARVAGLAERIARQHPAARVERQRTRLLRLLSRAEDNTQGRLAGFAGQVRAAAAKLDVLSPLASLGRGYSICRRQDGTVVRSTGQVVRGEHVAVRVTDGSIGCEVVQAEAE